MDKVKSFFAEFVKTRTVIYYVVFGLSVLAFVMGIVATACLSGAGATALPLVITLLGLLTFVGLSVIGQEKFGAGAVSVASFIALVVIICEVFEFYLGAIQDQAMGGFNIFAIEGLIALIVSIAVLLICSIASNVFAWLKLTKQNVPEVGARSEQGVLEESGSERDSTASAGGSTEKTEEAE